MSIEVDQSFRSTGAKARQRQRVRYGARAGVALVAISVIGLATWALWPSGDADDGGGEVAVDETLDDGFAMVQTEGEEIIAAPVAPPADVFIDLPRDPMILRFGASDSGGGKRLPGPPNLDIGRVGVPTPERLTAFTDRLIRAEQRLNVTIPSSRDDLALFQARRSQGIAELVDATPAPTPVTEVGGEGTQVTVDGDDGSWGELIGGEGGDGEGADEAVYTETVIENTTSLALTERESRRAQLFDDAIVVVRTQRSLLDVMLDNGFNEETATPVVTAVERVLGLSVDLFPGAVVAMRWTSDFGQRRLMQISVYTSDGYLGTVAQIGLGRFEAAADPWYADDLLTRSDSVRADVRAAGDVRLLDALYSAGVRNGLPATLVGELIVLVSQSYDLDRFASTEDEVTILHTTEEVPGQGGAGQLLFVGIDGPSGEFNCYVTPSDTPAGFECFDFNATTGGPGTGNLGGGLIAPVAGTMTSRFGPRNHPILKQVRLHAGIDWAAPTGTPLYAVADGTVSVAGVGGGYGNVVYIDHAGGVQSRYAHLDRFSPLGKAGTAVKQGDVIGFVGTTGRSTGPHLHFEIRVSGTPVDPLTFVGNVPSAPAVASSGGGSSPTGSGAVEALVNQIIKVESAGNANAKNPLSTATGLGQFIESTWLRMMRSYRPDLVATMSRQQLLNLRTDPGLSREMVTNLARENESFLRNRGHDITAGRLYLAHFLGPGGAHTALSSSPSATVLEVMGANVVNANPFLRGKVISDLTAWADRKMRGASGGGGSSTPSTTVTRVARVVPPEVKEFKEAVDGVLESL